MGDIVAFHKYCSISFEVITTLCLADRRRVIYLTKGKGKGKEKRKNQPSEKKGRKSDSSYVDLSWSKEIGYHWLPSVSTFRHHISLRRGSQHVEPIRNPPISMPQTRWPDIIPTIIPMLLRKSVQRRTPSGNPGSRWYWAKNFSGDVSIELVNSLVWLGMMVLAHSIKFGIFRIFFSFAGFQANLLELSH